MTTPKSLSLRHLARSLSLPTHKRIQLRPPYPEAELFSLTMAEVRLRSARIILSQKYGMCGSPVLQRLRIREFARIGSAVFAPPSEIQGSPSKSVGLFAGELVGLLG